MAEPIPPVDDIDDEYARASAAIKALRRAKPVSKAEARFQACELVRLQKTLIETSRQVAAAPHAGMNGGNDPAPFKNKELDAFTRALMKWLGKEFREMARTLGKEFAERDKRLNEIETVVRSLVERAGRHE
jgi:hypothetical protein